MRAASKRTAIRSLIIALFPTATHAMHPTFELTDDDHPALRAAVLAPLKAFNESRAGPGGHRPLNVLLKDEGGAVTGGLWGMTGYGYLYVQLLAVPETLRGQGIGAELMAMAETEAQARGCTGAWLDTFEFQARGFYEKLGYRCFGEIPDYPPGFARYFLRKTLAD
jgi:GNAT superfamily N-acetyltransferase